MTTIKCNPHTARSAKTAKPILRSRHLTAFALLTLTLALATLPVLGQTVAYNKDIESYKHLEQIPVTTDDQTASGKAMLQIEYNNDEAKNLIKDGNASTWTSVKDSGSTEGLEHFDKAAANYTFTTSNTDRGDWEWTTVANSVLSPANPTNGQRQFTVWNSVPIRKGNIYIFEAWVKGSENASNLATVYLANYNNNEVFANTNPDKKVWYENTLYLPITTEWEKVRLEFGPALEDLQNNAFCSIQARGYTGTLEIKDIKILTNNEIFHYDNTAQHAFNPSRVEGTSIVSNTGTLIAKANTLGSFKVIPNVSLNEGTKYVADLNISGSVAGEITVKLGSATNTINLTGGEQTITVNFPPQALTQTAPLIIDPVSSTGSVYNGTIIVSSAKVGHYTNETTNNDFVKVTKLTPDNITRIEGTKPYNVDVPEHGTYLQIPRSNDQFRPQCMTDLTFTKGCTYTFTAYASMDYDNVDNGVSGYEGVSRTPRTIHLQFGSNSGNEIERIITIPETYGKIEVSFDWEDETVTGAYCIFLSYWGRTADFNIDTVQLSETKHSGYTEDQHSTYSGDWGGEYADEYIPAISDNVLIAKPSDFNVQFANNLTMKTGVTYQVKAKIKGTKVGNVQAQFGTWDPKLTVNIPITTEYANVEETFPVNTLDMEKKAFFAIWSNGYDGDIEIESITLTSDEVEEVGNQVTTIDSNVSAFIEYDADNNEYSSSNKRKKRYFMALQNQKFESGKTYYISAKIKGSRASQTGEGANIIVQNASKNTPSSWGWGNNIKHEITTGWSIVTTTFEPEEDVNGGYVSFHIGDYDGTFEVDWISVSDSEDGIPHTTTNPVSQGTDGNYFDVTLPAHSEVENYYFMFGRERYNANYGTPMTFVVYDITNPSQTPTPELGSFTVGGTVSADLASRLSELFLKSVIVPAGSTKLRFVCTSTYNNSSVIKENNGALYELPVMQMNRFAVYKETQAFEKNSNTGSDIWAYPFISRFQVEANGIPGNYPGNYKNNAGEEMGETLMDAAESLSGPGGKWRNPGYTLFNSDASDSWNTTQNPKKEGTSDCIDILLPDFQAANGNKKSIFETLKSHGLLEQDDKIKVVIYLSRFSRDWSQGFPTHIEYGLSADTGIEEESGLSKGYVSDIYESGSMILPLPTVEDSYTVAVPIYVDKGCRRIRLQCLENDRPQWAEDKDKHILISDISGYIALPKLDLDEFNYDALYNERLDDVEKADLSEESKRTQLVRLSNYEWTTTLGILGTTDNGLKINDPTNWADDWLRLITQVNGSQYGNAALDLANFEYIDINSNNDIDGITSEVRNDNQWVGNRQPTYTMTHEILALPGERVDLYPYSDIHQSNYYMDYIV
ncbi:MAG: hypothetical protein K2K32_01605, partial [Muribaculaceae bacterium]|nr:hypothetical protein [Muribaculaceae bacterium]